jgi:hypothetical protein
MQRAVMLPLPSYSLKVVEAASDLKKKPDRVRGDWAMAQYIAATEMEDAAARDKVMAEILKYNEDARIAWAMLAGNVSYEPARSIQAA